MCIRFFDKKCWDNILHQNTAHLKLTHTFSIHCPSQFYRVSFMICQYCSQTYSRSTLNTKSCLYCPYVDFFKTEHISEKGGLQILFPETKLWNVENTCITIQAKYILYIYNLYQYVFNILQILYCINQIVYMTSTNILVTYRTEHNLSFYQLSHKQESEYTDM